MTGDHTSPPTSFPSASHGPCSTRLHNSSMPRHHFRLPGRYSNHLRLSDLLQEINSIKQGERSIIEYYTDSKILWEESDSLRPLPSCSCKTKCSYNMMKIMAGYMDSECIMSFLKGLGEAYNAVKT